jgi:hypothetical protein
MALRVARGLFRLWLVLSVLWIGGVVLAKWSTLISADWGEILNVAPWEEVPPWIFYQRKAIWSAALLAFVPPALLLAFGSALAWAFRGFR